MSTEIQAISVRDLQIIAEEASKSRLFGLDKSQAFTLGLLAQARGLNPVEAFLRYHVIQGRPAMKSEAMLAEFQRYGGNVEWVVSNGDECRAIFKHPKHAPKGFEVHVTLKELKESGVAMAGGRLKDPYRQYPAQMLRARCVSQGVRAVDPGVILGCYTPEEIGDMDKPKVVETTARVVPPDTRQPSAGEIGDELVGQLNAPRVKDRHAPVAAEVERIKQHKDIDTRPHLRVIDALIDATNNEWKCDCEDYNLAYEPILANVFQVQNALGTSAIETNLIASDYLDDANGKRDPKKLVAFLSKWQAKYPDDFYALANAYCVNKLTEARKAANLAEYVSDEPEAPAENVTQEVEEVEI